MGAILRGIGVHVPENILTNADLERMVETSDEWIVSRTGIHARRFADPDVTSSQLGAQAAQEAMQAAGVSADDIDLIICATSTPDMIFPSTACIVQAKLDRKSVV